MRSTPLSLKKKLSLTGFLILGIHPLVHNLSLAKPSEIQLSLPGKPTESLRHQWIFVETQTGQKILGAQLIVNLPATYSGNQVSVTAVEGDSVFWNPKWARPGKLMIAVGSLNPKVNVKFSNGSTLEFRLKVILDEMQFQDSDCKTNNIKLNFKNKNLGTFLGISCKAKEDRIQVVVSVPQEADLDSSNLFETDGKGERWKSYDINRSTLVGSKNEIGKFSFNQQGKKFSFDLVFEETKVNSQKSTSEKSEPNIRTSAGLGVSSLSAQSSSDSSSQVAPNGNFEMITLPMWWKLAFNAGLLYALPLQKASHYNFFAGTGPRFSFGSTGKNFFALFFQYAAIGHDQEAGTKILSLRHNQIGIRILNSFAVGTRGAFGLAIDYSGLGGNSTSTGVLLKYESINENFKGWGVGLQLQKQTAKSTTDQFSFGQTSLIGTFVF